MLIWVDYIIIGIVVLSTLVSFLRGLVREVLSLVGWVMAFGVAWRFFPDIAVQFTGVIDQEYVRKIAAFAALFVVTLMVFGLANYIIGSLLKKAGLSGTDRMLGMLFGAARGCLLIAAVVMGFEVAKLPHGEWWNQSVLLASFQELAAWLMQHFPQNVVKI